MGSDSAERVTVEDWDYAVLVVKRLLTERQQMLMALNRELGGRRCKPSQKRWARQGVSDLELVLRVLKEGSELMTYTPQTTRTA